MVPAVLAALPLAFGLALAALPVVLTMVMGERADPVLASVDRWMTRQSTVIVAAVLLVLGIVLTVNGLAAL